MAATRATFACLLALPLVLAVYSPAHAHGAKEPEPVSVTGEVLDLACWVAQGARGRSNAICAEHHTFSFQPLGLLTSEGTLYVLYADHHGPFGYDQCRRLAGETVTVTGVVSEKGDVRVLEVREVVRAVERSKP